MRLIQRVRLFAVASLLTAGAGFASPRAQPFREVSKMSVEELEAAKLGSRANVNVFGNQQEDKPKPFPWMAATLAGLCFLIAAPIGARAYLKTARELAPLEPQRRADAEDDGYSRD